MSDEELILRGLLAVMKAVHWVAMDLDKSRGADGFRPTSDEVTSLFNPRKDGGEPWETESLRELIRERLGEKT